jgi:hypothetical protein
MISVYVRGTVLKCTRYKYRYKYEVHVQVRVRGTGTGTGTRYVRGTGTRYTYRYEVQVRGTSIQVQVSFVLPRVPSVSTLVRFYVERFYYTLGTRGNTKEGTGTRYRYRYPYELDKQVWVYKSVVRQKLVKNL